MQVTRGHSKGPRSNLGHVSSKCANIRHQKNAKLFIARAAAQLFLLQSGVIFLLLFYRIIIFYFCRQCSLLVCPEIKSNCPGTSANYPNGYYSLVYTLEPRIIFSLKFIMSNLHNNFALV